MQRRAARKFQKKDNAVAKLVGCFRSGVVEGSADRAQQFAKHFKVSEQVEFLKKSRTGIAVGTPARLIALLDDGESHPVVHLLYAGGWLTSLGRRIIC